MNSKAFGDLISSRGARLVLLSSEAKQNYYTNKFKQQNIIVLPMPDVRSVAFERFFQVIEQSSIQTRRVFMDNMTYLYRIPGHGISSALILLKKLPRFLFSIACYGLGMLGKPWRCMLRALYEHYPSSHFSKLFDEYPPDLVLCPTMVFSEDYCLLREAKRRGVRTVGIIFSWDTMFSKTFLRLHPDKILAQTSFIKDKVAALGDYPISKISVTGVLQYDRYFNQSSRTRLLAREEFILSLGGDPKRKLILYAFSGKAGLQTDSDIVDMLYQAIKIGAVKEPVNVLLRPYPRYDFSEEKMTMLKKKYGFLGERSTIVLSKALRGKEWEMDEPATDFLTNSLAHADVIITIYSTLLVEGAIFDKPLVSVAFDGYHTHPYWNSARRFFDWDHLRSIRRSGGVYIAKSQEEFFLQINAYLTDPTLDHEGRMRIVREQCEQTDGQAADRVLQEINKELAL